MWDTMTAWTSLLRWQSDINLGVMEIPHWLFTLLCGVLFGLLTYLGTKKSFQHCELKDGYWSIGVGLLGGMISALLVMSVLGFESQHTPVVLPSEIGRNWRVIYHLSLIALLFMVTATDVRSYFILEWTCWLGIAIGILGATASGEFQLVHVWIDWNQEQPQLSGPYIPDWLANHQHLHGLAWSVAGMLTGVVLAWLTKKVSSFVLSMPTLGTGDIYLMAMIGAYLGWQPTIIAFAISPIFALIFGATLRGISNQPALPYGPFLALGAIVTMFFWRAIWMFEIRLTLAPDPSRDSIFAIRRFFGDWVSLLMTFGLATVLFVGLLSLLRFYKSLDLKK